jgi:N-methylhydantoinase A
MVANLRTTVIGRRTTFDLTALRPPAAGLRSGARTRPAYFEGGWRVAEVHRREGLGSGARIHGPAIVEQMDATVVLDPGAAGEVDELGNLVVTV